MHNDCCGHICTDEGFAPDQLRCQREVGHPGAHFVDVTEDVLAKRYWWVPWTGERGVNHYPMAAETSGAGIL